MPPAARPLLVLVVLAAAVAAGCSAAPDSGVRIERLSPTPVVAPASVAVAVSAPGAPAPATTAGPALRAPPPPAVPATSPPAAARGDGGRLSPPARVPGAAVMRPGALREDEALRDVIERALGADADHAAVVVKRLGDGAGAAWNAGRIYYAASLYKLEVLYEAFRQRQAGALDFDRRVVVTERYASEDLGTSSRLPLGPEGDVAVGDAVRAMVMYSDNTSATLLLDLLGHRNIDATMAALGLTDSSVNTTELPTTAWDMARVMEAIARGEGLDARAAQEMTALLLDQETRAGIPRGLPAAVPAGNKTGTWSGSTHDVALVFAPAGAYVLAVLTDGSWDWDPITRVSRAVYDYWSGAQPAAGNR